MRPIKTGIRSEYVQRKNVRFCFISIGWVHLVIKRKNFDFENHWSIFTVFVKKDMTSDLNMSNGKLSGFILFPFFYFNLVIKLRNFDFESHWNTLILFDQKKLSHIWICPINYSYVVWASLFELHFGNKLRNKDF